MSKARLLFLLVLFAFACNTKQGGNDQPEGQGQTAPDEKPSGSKSLDGVVVVIEGERNDLKAHADGYKAKSTGLKIKVEGDRVKVKGGDGKQLAKVKSKPDGFKVYGGEGEEEAILKGKRRGDGYKLVRKPSDEELGRVEKGGGTMGGQTVTVASGEVKRGDRVVAVVEGDAPATAAALLAATELTKSQRLAMFVFAIEVAK